MLGVRFFSPERPLTSDRNVPDGSTPAGQGSSDPNGYFRPLSVSRLNYPIFPIAEVQQSSNSTLLVP